MQAQALIALFPRRFWSGKEQHVGQCHGQIGRELGFLSVIYENQRSTYARVWMYSERQTSRAKQTFGLSPALCATPTTNPDEFHPNFMTLQECP